MKNALYDLKLNPKLCTSIGLDHFSDGDLAKILSNYSKHLTKNEKRHITKYMKHVKVIAPNRYERLIQHINAEDTTRDGPDDSRYTSEVEITKWNRETYERQLKLFPSLLSFIEQAGIKQYFLFV
jgi:hypothetical protein